MKKMLLLIVLAGALSGCYQPYLSCGSTNEHGIAGVKCQDQSFSIGPVKSTVECPPGYVCQ